MTTSALCRSSLSMSVFVVSARLLLGVRSDSQNVFRHRRDPAAVSGLEGQLVQRPVADLVLGLAAVTRGAGDGLVDALANEVERFLDLNGINAPDNQKGSHFDFLLILMIFGDGGLFHMSFLSAAAVSFLPASVGL